MESPKQKTLNYPAVALVLSENDSEQVDEIGTATLHVGQQWVKCMVSQAQGGYWFCRHCKAAETATALNPTLQPEDQHRT